MIAITDFENLLKQTMGLDAVSIGSAAIERAVGERRAACKLASLEEYWQHVSTSESERQQLIEAVVVPETWFFRDREAFAALSRIVSEDRPARRPNGPLRILSVPSSTGEEPYSIAIALLEAGLPATQFRVDAVDISLRALAQAERAIYGKNSFRGDELGFRDRHFEPTSHGYRLSDAVRMQVRFQQANLFTAECLAGTEVYDVIFCRNLLIYFDRDTQNRAIKIVERLLTPKGVLFVAPCETALVMSHNFVSAKIPLAFAFHKAVHGPRKSISNPAAVVERSSIRQGISYNAPARRPKPAPSARPFSAPYAYSAPAVLTEPKMTIDEALRLADQGRFADAAKYCEEYVRRHGPSAQAFHLMGLVHDATGNHPEAEEYYRKALYLDPDHHESLTHLAFLIERSGNLSAAQALRNRARRVEQKSTSK